MYAVPKEIPTRLFARLPEELRLRDRSSGWAFGKESGTMHSFLEGPSFDREGNLYLVDIPYGRILRVAPDGTFSQVARSEEHTSELQSLMRISYAVFCLKKKKQITNSNSYA